ncbi:MAG TPA: heparan-alpha-glucosaminide N-acetyltransferase domain-containing protein [Microbacterium sp.]|uniref:heparan-alpha-glucosaminide N-acetyltransferase domain-containing protein n=1 Tax=Microbacterium sp. TaxID=51671 RepID=UPI002BC393AB|nr:heparan-alpha-glucosaminide N-acetyltransferase domain-containing protein [Microbacterium sp.]HWI32119.1 heparan-alpha-glucosaminide N-acetyltransferase domain-containing protein [Microbacterium sp.]
MDLARGLAVIGMFAAHLLQIPPFDWADAATWHDVVNGRSSILFATLAGVSIGLVTGRTEPFTQPALGLARRRLAVRALLVWVLGMLLVALDVPVFVILPAYAVLFLIVLPLLQLPAAWLFALAAAIAGTMPFVQYVVHGWQIWLTPQGWLIETAFGGHYPFLVWSAFVVAGLGIGRLPFSRPSVAAALLGVGAALAFAGYALGAATAALRAADPASVWAFVTSAEPHGSGIAEVVGSGGFAIAVIGLCVLVTGTPITWVVLPLRAVGAMALTAYAGQLVAWAVLQPAPAPGESELSAFRALEPFWPFTIWTIALCSVWTLLLGRGPVEWVIHRGVRFAARR